MKTKFWLLNAYNPRRVRVKANGGGGEPSHLLQKNFNSAAFSDRPVYVCGRLIKHFHVSNKFFSDPRIVAQGVNDKCKIASVFLEEVYLHVRGAALSRSRVDAKLPVSVKADECEKLTQVADLWVLLGVF